MASGVEALLVCPICLEIFNSPKTLPCDHSFCKQCLANMVASQILSKKKEEIKADKEFVIVCPCCKSVFKEFKTISQLKKSLLLRQLMDTVENAENNGDGSRKSVCSCMKDAHYKCMDCDKFLCSSCLQKNTNLHGGHFVVQIISGKSTGFLCMNHELLQEYHCEDCNKALCFDCILESHEKHKVKTATSMNENSILKMTVCKDLLSEYDSLIEGLEQTAESLVKDIEAEGIMCRVELKKQQLDVISLLCNSFEKAHQDVEESVKARIIAIYEYVKNAKRSRTVTDSIVDALTGSLDDTNNVGMLIPPDKIDEIRLKCENDVISIKTLKENLKDFRLNKFENLKAKSVSLVPRIQEWFGYSDIENMHHERERDSNTILLAQLESLRLALIGQFPPDVQKHNMGTELKYMARDQAPAYHPLYQDLQDFGYAVADSTSQHGGRYGGAPTEEDRLQQDFLSLNFDTWQQDHQKSGSAPRHQDETSTQNQPYRNVPNASIKQYRGDAREQDGQSRDLSFQSLREACEAEQEATTGPLEIDMMIFQAELNELFDSTCFTNEEITAWIEMRLPLSQISCQEFISALAITIYRRGIGGRESKLHVTPIQRYSPLLLKYIGENEERQLQALIVAERLSHAQNHPSGYLRRICEALHEASVVSCNTMVKWKMMTLKENEEFNGCLDVLSFIDWIKLLGDDV